MSNMYDVDWVEQARSYRRCLQITCWAVPVLLVIAALMAYLGFYAGAAFLAVIDVTQNVPMIFHWRHRLRLAEQMVKISEDKKRGKTCNA